MDSLPCQRPWTGFVVALLVDRAVANLLAIQGQQPGPVGSPLHKTTAARHDTYGVQIEALSILAILATCMSQCLKCGRKPAGTVIPHPGVAGLLGES